MWCLYRTCDGCHASHVVLAQAVHDAIWPTAAGQGSIFIAAVQRVLSVSGGPGRCREALVQQLYNCYRPPVPAGTFGDLLACLTAQLQYRARVANAIVHDASTKAAASTAASLPGPSLSSAGGTDDAGTAGAGPAEEKAGPWEGPEHRRPEAGALGVSDRGTGFGGRRGGGSELAEGKASPEVAGGLALERLASASPLKVLHEFAPCLSSGALISLVSSQPCQASLSPPPCCCTPAFLRHSRAQACFFLLLLPLRTRARLCVCLRVCECACVCVFLQLRGCLLLQRC